MDRAAGKSQAWWHAVLLATLASLLLSACATVEKPAFILGYDLPEETRRQVWPAAATGEVPRYVYLGKIRGDENFPQPKAENGLRSVFEALVGLVAGESAPRHLDRPQSGVVDESGRVLVTDLGHSTSGNRPTVRAASSPRWASRWGWTAKPSSPMPNWHWWRGSTARATRGRQSARASCHGPTE
jgi:hypothetical protein